MTSSHGALPGRVLDPIGFWRISEDESVDGSDKRPWPQFHGARNIDRSMELTFMRNGFIESYEFGYHVCRVCGLQSKDTGCVSLTDGFFVWPEGLVHYVEVHNVVLPQEFLDHIRLTGSSLLEKRNEVSKNKAGHSIAIWNRDTALPEAVSEDVARWVVANASPFVWQPSCENDECSLRCCWR